MEWTQSHEHKIKQHIHDGKSGPGFTEVLGEVIYELTGVRRHRKDNSTILTVLKARKAKLCPTRPNGKTEPKAEEKLPERAENASLITQFARELRKLPADNEESIAEHLREIQSLASKLPAAVQRDRTSISYMEAKDMEMAKPNTKLNGAVSSFRELALLAKNREEQPFGLYLTEQLPENYLALTSVNHFYRVDAFYFLASTLICDFGDFSDGNPSMDWLYTTLTVPSLQLITQIRLRFVVGHMYYFPKKLWPSVRVLHIELWPRDPTRVDPTDRTWGKQTRTLLEEMVQLGVKVVVHFRWKNDCEIFESEYLGRGWRMIGGDGDWDEEEDGKRGVGETGMCWRSYETCQVLSRWK